jgi:ribonucleoside-diphosphate reductase alpha chain
MYKPMKERFKKNLDLAILENPLVPRQSENARWLLEQRYFAERYDPEIKGLRKERSFEEFARRVSRIVCSAESLYRTAGDIEWVRCLEKNLFADLVEGRFIFNSPCLFASGAGMTRVPELADLIYRSPDEMELADYRRLYDNKTDNQQLFACFVIDIPDSIEGVFDSVRDAAIISKYGGGVGGNFGHLRERGSDIKGGTGGKASGPVSFMETWNTMGSVVVQGGRRRAALMGMLPDDHPDIEQFMDAKTEEGKLSYFNISVCVSDELVAAAREKRPFALHSRADGHTVRTVQGDELWNKLCRNAWRRGDPGVFFIDRANADNLLKLSGDFDIESTNPCGEQPLPTYTSCNLGSINISKFVALDETGRRSFDMNAFMDQVYRSTYYLDLVIDATSYPLKRIGERTKRIRPVGLGLMGLADSAIMLGDVYGSESFKRFCDDLGAHMAGSALMATVDAVDSMGKEPFSESFAVAELFEKEHQVHGGEIFAHQWIDEMTMEGYNEFIAQMRSRGQVPYTLLNTLEVLPRVLGENCLPQLKRVMQALLEGKLRNSRRLSIAPTGSISMIFDASAGIEPNFAWRWSRKVMKSDGDGWEVREYFHPLITQKEIDELNGAGKISDPRFVTAYDISPEQHVDVTGIFARYVDSGISKTVNLPNSATVDDVREVYEKCYDMGCKGITIYRDGSRDNQPIETKKQEGRKAPAAEPQTTVGKADAEEKISAAVAEITPQGEHTVRVHEHAPYSSKVKQRSTPIVFGKTIKDRTPWGSLWVTLNYDGNEPFEVFATLGKSGSELKAMTEAISRVISIGLRSGCRLDDFIGTLRGISGKEYWMFDCDENEMVRSIPDAVALLLRKLTDQHGAMPVRKPGAGEPQSELVCPECGAPMEMVAGCAYCFSCGYSPCK